MARSGLVGIAPLLLALGAAGGCGGKSIHLGNGWPDGGPCATATTSANEVLWIGDSWILVTGSQHTRVRDLARASHAIGPTDDYTIRAAAASNMAAIVNQYATQESSANEGQGRDHGRRHLGDTIIANGSDASVASVVATFGQFLTQVANDGTVQHVVYFMPPPLGAIPGVAALSPLMQQACATSSVLCHYLDLKQLWSVHPEYTDANVGFLRRTMDRRPWLMRSGWSCNKTALRNDSRGRFRDRIAPQLAYT